MAEDNLIAAARTGSGLTQAKAASICGISTDAYRTREKRPGEFRVKELRLLAASMNEGSRKILKDAVLSNFFARMI